MQPSLTTVLAFAIGIQRFAITADSILEIIRAVSMTRLPKAPAVIEGLIDLRGAVIPVLDIRARFRLPPRPLDPADHLVIARAGRRVVGIRVDRALDILTLPEHAIDAVYGIVPASDYVAGVARLPDGLILIHDLDTFLSDAEADEVAGAVEQGMAS